MRFARALLARFRRTPPLVARDWLHQQTGHDSAYWVEWIQHRISSTWRENPDDPKHPLCDPVDDWLIPLVIQVERCLNVERTAGRRGHGDENIGMACILSMILATWGGRIARAKSMDPHRPVALRRQAWSTWFNYTGNMIDQLINEARDPDYFDQPWESPWLPDATDGDFV